jgi:hypothetical protein
MIEMFLRLTKPSFPGIHSAFPHLTARTDVCPRLTANILECRDKSPL